MITDSKGGCTMITTLSEKVKVCIAIEATTAEIYHLLSARLPEARGLWHDLAVSEENHANILVVGAGYLRNRQLPEEIVPGSQELIDETFRLVRAAKSEIADEEQLSLRDALALALKIEHSTAESYFQEIIMGDTDNPVIARLQQLRKDELTHVERINDFMKDKGFTRGTMN